MLTQWPRPSEQTLVENYETCPSLPHYKSPLTKVNHDVHMFKRPNVNYNLTKLTCVPDDVRAGVHTFKRSNFNVEEMIASLEGGILTTPARIQHELSMAAWYEL